MVAEFSVEVANVFGMFKYELDQAESHELLGLGCLLLML